MNNLKIGGYRLARVKKVAAVLIAWFNMLHCVCCFFQIMVIVAVSSRRNSSFRRLEYTDSSEDESADEGEVKSRPRKRKRSQSLDGVVGAIRESASLPSCAIRDAMERIFRAVEYAGLPKNSELVNCELLNLTNFSIGGRRQLTQTIGGDFNLVNSTNNNEDSGEEKNVNEDEDPSDMCDTSTGSSEASLDGMDEVMSKLRKRKKSQSSDRLVEAIIESFVTLTSRIRESTGKLCRTFEDVALSVKRETVYQALLDLPNLPMVKKIQAYERIGWDRSLADAFLSINNDEKGEWVRTFLDDPANGGN